MEPADGGWHLDPGAHVVLPMDSDTDDVGDDDGDSSEDEVWHDAQADLAAAVAAEVVLEEGGCMDVDVNEPAHPPPAADAEAIKVPKEKTAEWYRFHHHTPITPSHDKTVLDVCFWLARLKHEFRVSDAAIDAICGMIHFLILPRDNMVPPSYHLVRGALGVPDSKQYVQHVCDQCWMLFPRLTPDQYRHNRGQRCANRGCGNRRFHKTFGKKGIAKRCVYMFGDMETFVDLISKPGMLQEILRQRKEDFDDPGSFWRSAAGVAINRACRGLFNNLDASKDEIAILVSFGTRPRPRWCTFTSCLNGW